MKLLTKEEEQAHYRATLMGGTLGGLAGLTVGVLGVWGASRRYHFINQLTPALKAFLVTSSGTFAGIVSADHASRAFESERNPIDVEYKQREKERAAADVSGKSWTQRAMDFGRKERYKIVGASWVASMATAFALVNRNKYLTGPQKLVQARVYAQFLTLGVLVASAAFEISDAKNDEGKLWEKVKYVDPNDPEHKRMLEREQLVEEDQGDTFWKDMVAAEEERLKEQERGRKRLEREKRGKKPHKDEGKKEDKKDEGKQEGKEEKGKEDGEAGKGEHGKEEKGSEPEQKKRVNSANEAKDQEDGKPAKAKK